MAYIGASPSTAAFITDQFSGTGSQTTFTMSVAPATTSSMIVAITGVLQDPSTYSINGNTLTLDPAPPAGTGNISVRYLGIPASGVVTTAYRTVTEFTATSGQTTFTPPSYTVGFINVFRNGVRLGAANFTATNGSTVVLTNAATIGDLITIESFQVSSVLNAIPATGGSILPLYLDRGNNTGTGAMQVPIGTTAQRPVSPTDGMLRFNTTLNYMEEYRQGQWLAISNVFTASGGTTTDIGSFRYHTFTTSGSFIVTSGTTSVDAIIVAGGGGGGQNNGGGGGAGGVITTTFTVVPGAYSVVVGSGGAGASTSGASGANGSNSVFNNLTAIGGGGGMGGNFGVGGSGGPVAGNGGSGGGQSRSVGSPGSGTAGQGNAGRNNRAMAEGGGGGGATSGGSAGSNGGSGLTWVNGSTYGGGGGGGAEGAGNTAGLGGSGGGGRGGSAGGATPASGWVTGAGENGTANTGGGGGSADNPGSALGGNGGSGVVIIRYTL